MRRGVLSALVLVVAVLGHGADLRLELDPVATRATFTLASTLHEVHGILRLERGSLRWDPDSGATSGEVVLDATRTATGNSSRDKKMHRDVLLSARFPRIVFEPRSVVGSFAGDGEHEVRLSGEVELCGARHELVIPALVQRRGDAVHARATFVVPYVAWGLDDPSMLVLRVAKEVTVTLDVHGRLVP